MMQRDATFPRNKDGQRSGGGRFVRPTQVRVGGRADRLHPAAAGVGLYILVTVGRLQELVPLLNGMPLAKIALALALFGIFVAPAGRNRPLSGIPISRHLIVLTFLAVFSVAVSVWKSHSLSFLVTGFLANVFLFYLLVKSADNDTTLNFFAGTLLVSALMLVLPALTLTGAERGEASTAYDANDLASVLVTLLPLAIVAVFSGRRKFFWIAISLVLGAGVVATGSRGGFLGLLAVVFYLVWVPIPGRKNARAGKGSRLALLALLGVFSVAVVGGAAWERIGSLTNLESDYNLQSETGRLAIWKRGLGIMADRPWGVGIEAFEAAEGMEGGRFKAAHNSLIQIGAELGIAGLLVFVSMCLAAYRLLGRHLDALAGTGEAPRSVALAAALRAGLVGFFVTGFFLSHAYAPVLYALLGMAVAVTCVAENARPTEELRLKTSRRT